MAEGEATPRGRLNHRSDARSSLLPPNYTISETKQRRSERENPKDRRRVGRPARAAEERSKEYTWILYLVTDERREETVAELRQERSGAVVVVRVGEDRCHRNDNCQPEPLARPGMDRDSRTSTFHSYFQGQRLVRVKVTDSREGV